MSHERFFVILLNKEIIREQRITLKGNRWLPDEPVSGINNNKGSKVWSKNEADFFLTMPSIIKIESF